MKTIKVRPVEKIKIELEDEEYIVSFNMLSMAYVQEEITKLGDIQLNQISPARMAAIILYAGIKPEREDFTMDEAVALAINMGPGNYTEIMKEYNDATFDSLDPENKNIVKKMVAQLLVQKK